MSSSSNNSNSRYSLSHLLNPSNSHNSKDTALNFCPRPTGANNDNTHSNYNTMNDTINNIINYTNYNVVNYPDSNITPGPCSVASTPNLAASAPTQSGLSTPASLSTNGSVSDLSNKGWRDKAVEHTSQNKQVDMLTDDSVSATTGNTGSTFANMNLDSSAQTGQFGETLNCEERFPNSSTSMRNSVQIQPVPTYHPVSDYYYCWPPNTPNQNSVPALALSTGNGPDQTFAHNDPSFVSPPLAPKPSAVVHNQNNFQNVPPLTLIPSSPNRPSWPYRHPFNPIVIDSSRARLKPTMQNLQKPIRNFNATTSAATVDIIPRIPDHSVSPPCFTTSEGNKEGLSEIPGLYKLIKGEGGKKQWKCTYIFPPSAPGGPRLTCGHLTHQPRDRIRHINIHAREEGLLMEAGQLHMKDAVAYPHRVEAAFECRVPDCQYYKKKGERFRVVGYRVDGIKTKHNQLYHPEIGRRRRLLMRRREQVRNAMAGNHGDEKIPGE